MKKKTKKKTKGFWESLFGGKSKKKKEEADSDDIYSRKS